MLSPLFIHCIFKPQKRDGITIYPIGLPASSLFVEYSKNNASSGIISGVSGKTCAYAGKNEVVKEVKTDKGSPMREIRALTTMEVNDIVDPSIQYGRYAWKTPQGDIYIASSHLVGTKPDTKNNKLNKENLSEIVRVMGIIDTPQKFKNINNSIFAPIRLSFPLHNDLKAGNILISDKEASILDFEYLDFYNIFSRKSGKKHSNFCNLSDIPEIPSNLRNMECRLLLPYFQEISPAEAKKLFKEYLTIKSQYYKKQSAQYRNLAECFSHANPLNLPFRKKLEHISQKQKIISEFLKNNNEEAMYAEAVKIQIAGFIYRLSTNYHARPIEINHEQVKSYIEDALCYFKDKSNSVDTVAREYYKICADVVEKWGEIIPNIGKKIPNYYESVLERSMPVTEGFQPTAITNNHQTTLDEILL